MARGRSYLEDLTGKGRQLDIDSNGNLPVKDSRMTFDSGKLITQATVSIGQVDIGITHIADPVTDTQAEVKDDGTNDALVVVQNSQPLPTGAATSAKQLPDGHSVAVSNMIPAVETGLATSAKQLPDQHGVKIVDSSGVSKGVLMVDQALVSVPYYYAISDGNVTGHVAWDRLAINSDIDQTTEDVWSVGGTYIFPANAQQMELVSTSVEDDPDKGGAVAGTGIHTVTLYYLTNDFTEKTEDINLNGTGVVTTVGTDIFRVQALKAKVCGTGGQAAGVISIRNLADTPIYSQIETGLTRSRNSIYTVPKGKKLFINSMYVGVSAATTTGTTVTLKAKYDHDAAAIRTFFLPHAEITTGSGVNKEFSIPISFPAGVDIKCSASTQSNNTTVNVGMRGWLESA